VTPEKLTSNNVPNKRDDVAPNDEPWPTEQIGIGPADHECNSAADSVYSRKECRIAGSAKLRGD